MYWHQYNFQALPNWCYFLIDHLQCTPKIDKDQYLIVGVIDTLSAFVEHPEVIADRLELAAEVLGNPTQVVAGTDCGFDTSAGMGRLTSDVVWSKLSALRDGAVIASNRLFA